ncbi:MAG: molybdopterin-binding domain-containing protein [Acidimicrobiales bacterium]
MALLPLHDDPDRLRQPQVRRADRWHEVSFDDASGEIESHLLPSVTATGPTASPYLESPNVHDHAASTYNRVLRWAIGTDQRYSASTVDQMPKPVASGLLFGDGLAVAVPGIDRTDYLLVLGENSLVSNGSLFSAPGLPARIAELHRRGGRLVVVDPRRTRTAAVAGRTGIPAAAIRRLAKGVATAPSAAVYGRPPAGRSRTSTTLRPCPVARTPQLGQPATVAVVRFRWW